jgi:mono/diheme cytochrome c family protein
VSHGRYLAQGPAHCADCHADPAGGTDPFGDPVLSGGYALPTYLGDILAPNLTSDSATGIGAVADSALVRFFRHGIDRLGQVGLPIMRYEDMSDSDLVAVLSYLRILPPVPHAVPRSRYNFLGKITKAYFLKPFAPAALPPSAPPRSETAAYGGYLANAVSTCASCHTARNMKTGEYTGPRFAGGLVFEKADAPGTMAISPNLTPDPSTGAIAGWTRERFIARMRRGSVRAWSPMPWGPFSRMTEGDLGAIYLYLNSLEPVRRDNRAIKETP